MLSLGCCILCCVRVVYVALRRLNNGFVWVDRDGSASGTLDDLSRSLQAVLRLYDSMSSSYSNNTIYVKKTTQKTNIPLNIVCTDWYVYPFNSCCFHYLTKS